MTRNIIITVLAIAIIVVGVIYMKPTQTPAPIDTVSPTTTEQTGDTGRVINPGQPQPTDAPNVSTTTVQGIITEKDDGCFSDGICRIKVDGTWIITNQGWYNGPLGKVDSDIAVGTTVEAYGKVTPDGITMLGSNTYYVKILK